MNLRLRNLKKSVVLAKLDGFVSFNPSNIFYLTGFGEEGSFVFVSPNVGVTLFVSKLNYLSAKKYANCKIRIASDKFLRRYKNKKIGFDNTVSFARIEKLKKIGGVIFESCSGFVENLRLIKDQTELSKIRISCGISKKAIEYAEKKLHIGITEKELADEIEHFLRISGAEKSAFDVIVASGKNSSDPHHKPTDRKIQKDDVVVVDLGCVYENYKSDLTRTFFLDTMNRRTRSVFVTVSEAQKRAVCAIKDGVLCSKVDFAARDFVNNNGFGKYFIHGTGHGVGINIHEGPLISAKSDRVLKVGMVVTVEPGVYIPGKFGIRVEDTVLVTKSGCEILTV